jgi:hypothetical protein
MVVSKQHQQQHQQQPFLFHNKGRSSSFNYTNRDGILIVRTRAVLKCIIPIVRQITVTLTTINTCIGICFGILLFLLLQISVHKNVEISLPVVPTIMNPVPIVIAYAVSITGCGHDPITEGAAVLYHSIHRSSIHGSLNGKYDYMMYAIYHPSAKECAMSLRDLNYTLLERDTPIQVKDIQKEYLRTKIVSNGCCGEKELIKLEAYTLIQHPIVVHLDLDTLIVQPMDTIFDFMLHHPTYDNINPIQQQTLQQKVKDLIMWPNKPLPNRPINAMFTYDYNMVNPLVRYKPVQGGLLILRPNIQVYEEFKQIISQGDFRDGSGWGGKVGSFYGGMTFQGIIPYYYNVLHQNMYDSIELNRCYYNSMADNPRTEKTIDNIVHGPCRTGQTEKECLDCRTIPISKIYTTHYTICQKPWSCLRHEMELIQQQLCRTLTHEWYKVRYELQYSYWLSSLSQSSSSTNQLKQQYSNQNNNNFIIDYNNSLVLGYGTYDREQFYGYCTKSGSKGYIPIPKPYGTFVPSTSFNQPATTN